MTITSIVFNLPDLQVVQERLLRNATDMGNSIRPFYGDQTADRYTELLMEHLVLAAELVTAAVKGDAKKAKEKEKEWYRNADDIAVFLSSINPYLSKEEVQKMFYTHLALTKNEAVSMIQKKYKESVQLFDQIEEQALEMADMISGAIIMQFPYMF
nr:acetylglutamate kinase [Psychrobacillus vulpis]